MLGSGRMGNRLSATPTPESMVGQGVANTLENRCHTTPPPKGGAGGGDAASPVWRGVGHNLVPTPPFSGGDETERPTNTFALCQKSSRTVLTQSALHIRDLRVIEVFKQNAGVCANSGCYGITSSVKGDAGIVFVKPLKYHFATCSSEHIDAPNESRTFIQFNRDRLGRKLICIDNCHKKENLFHNLSAQIGSLTSRPSYEARPSAGCFRRLA